MNFHAADRGIDRMSERTRLPEGAIAIVGLAGRFPKAADVSTFWQNIIDGRDCVTHFTLDELEDAFDADTRSAANFVAARPVVEDVDLFDADFFGMYASEAALTDPQHRLFLECSWQALESAGYDPARYDGAIGVFAGCSMSTYLLKHVCQDRAVIDKVTSEYQVGSFPILIGNIQDVLATRVAYKLNLSGPAMTVGSACSTSAVAIVQACQSLLLYQADMALAGGVSLSFPQKRGYVYLEGGMASGDGVCRPYDADAQGTVFGGGCAVVVLKRAEDAIADRDNIHALIRGFGINNDGSDKVGFTAPSIDGQIACIRAAHAMAGVDATSIGYVEGHGTATPLGDPIEFEALKRAFGDQGRGYCALGSCKANVGHLDSAAGAAGLIKAALCLDRQQIPPLANFKRPNSRIDLAQSPFYLPADARPWPRSSTPRRAGVSSFGVGGTNVHLVLEEAPAVSAADASGRIGPVILPVSARTTTALVQLRNDLADHIDRTPGLDLDDVAFTLQEGRKPFNVRSAVVAATREDAVRLLRDTPRVATVGDAGRVREAAFMFPGQGAQYPGMAAALYRDEPEFRRLLDQGDEILRPLIGESLLALLYGRNPAAEDASHRIRSTVLAQPALFLVEHALARLWMNRGVTPSMMIGHSVGEFVAACIAGVYSYEDGLRIIAERGRLMQSLPPGAMLAVRASEAETRRQLVEGTEIAAINAASLCVVAGQIDRVAELESVLQAAGFAARRLHTSHAFHSAMMDPVVPQLAAFIGTVRLAEPVLPYISCVTGSWITAEQATDPAYWAQHCRAAVRFADGLEKLREPARPVLIEVGPGRTLATFAAQTKSADDPRAGAVCSLPEFGAGEDDGEFLLRATADAWSRGISIDWSTLHGERGHRVPLPTYPFERQRHWIEAPAVVASRVGVGVPIDPRAAQSGCDKPPSRDDAISLQPSEDADSMKNREQDLVSRVLDLLHKLSGTRYDASVQDVTFVEMGFDSLFLGQLATEVHKTWGVKLPFRQLLREYPSPHALAAHLCSLLPAAAEAARPAAAPIASTLPAPAAQVRTSVDPTMAAPPMPRQASPTGAAFETIFRDQLAAMQSLIGQQLNVLQSQAHATPTMARQDTSPKDVADPECLASPVKSAAAGSQSAGSQSDARAPAAEPSRFDTYKLVKSSGDARRFTVAQQRFIDDLVARYNARTPGSKALTAAHRKHLADPRTANGFRSEWKEIVYPLVCPRSKGSRIWDVDGNAYVDLVNGYGPIAFGHAPDFLTSALHDQIDTGFAIGPQSPLAGEVAEMFTRMTGNERVTFCNTGSEAVMAAMRVARAVTGRSKIVSFAGAYHGQFDEVIVKGQPAGCEPGARPAASGIPAELVSNMIVLPYGTPDSLAYIKAHASELAAVLVETVQSRRPGFLPVEFLRDLRTVTQQSGAALIFDEVVTGFRVHPGGMQSYLGIRADLATYGKVIGGGVPVGALAGKAAFMDALDGGTWRFGDDSMPEVAPTFFAGTFVRHPLVLVAMKAVLQHLEAEGPALQQRLSDRAATLAGRMAAAFRDRGIDCGVDVFSSYFHIDLSNAGRLAPLFYPLMRLNGVHMQEGFLGFLTTAHTDADLDLIVQAVNRSLDELVAVDAFPLARRPAAADGAQIPASSSGELTGLEKVVPLTEAQREIWMSAQLGDAASCAFNESASLRLRGVLDADALRSAFNDVVARHDALRGSFGATGERMRVAGAMSVDVAVADFTLFDCVAAEEKLARLISADAGRPFDLEQGPCVRACLVRIAADDAVLLVTAHHIVCDGWSLNVMMSDLASFYAARTGRRDDALPPARSFLDYGSAAEEAAQARAEAERFWLDQFKTIPDLPELPGDRSRPERRTFGGATHCDAIDAALYRQLKDKSAREGCTLFVTLFAAFQVLIGRLANHEDVVIAVPTAGQSLVDGGDSLIGHCVNFLPLRVPFKFEAPFAGHLAAVNSFVLDAFEHQDYTLGTLVQKLALPRSISRLPLTELQFNLETVGSHLAFEDLETSLRPNPKSFSNFDMFFNVIECREGLRIECDFNTDILERETVARWIDHYRVLLREIVADATRPIGTMPLMEKAQRDWLIDDLNATARDTSDLPSVHAWFREQASRSPDRVAVSHGGRSMTFRELDEASDRVAVRISSTVSGRQKRVAMALDRSIDMLVGLLGILKSGHTFVPLDPDHPVERLKLVLETARPAAIICGSDEIAAHAPSTTQVIQARTLPDAPALTRSTRETPAAADVAGTDCAYVIFTSGSTGIPKGVAVPHRALSNFLASMQQAPGFDDGDVLVAVTTVSFDIAALELFLPLVCGGRIVIASKEDVSGGFGLRDLIEKSGATVVQATPSLWRILLEAGFTPRAGLRMLCGGEPLPRDLADALTYGGGELWNMYGPTETTIWSSAGPVAPAPAPIDIGTAIANTQLHVLDARDQLQPIGVPGQLHIGGDGLAIGYFERPDLTDTAFVAISIDGREPTRLYRTGDLAIRRADGSIELLGRRDDQIKLRGFRIELGEIEAALRNLPGIAAAAAALRQSPQGEPRLAGYYVASEGSEPHPDDLADALNRRLPGYMVPSMWCRLECLPLTTSGKLDRKALPDAVQRVGTQGSGSRRLASTATQRRLAAVWQAVLGLDEIGIDDSLFSLGADSLQVFRMAARFADQGIEVQAKHLLLHPTIASLADFVDSRESSGSSLEKTVSLRAFRHGARRQGSVVA